jgi:hypothetical protein
MFDFIQVAQLRKRFRWETLRSRRFNMTEIPACEQSHPHQAFTVAVAQEQPPTGCDRSSAAAPRNRPSASSVL